MQPENAREDNEKRVPRERPSAQRIFTVGEGGLDMEDQELSTIRKMMRVETIFDPAETYIKAGLIKITPIEKGEDSPRQRNKITSKLAFLANMGSLQTRISFPRQHERDQAPPEPIEIKSRDSRSLG